jgi:Fe-S-cluster-containing hydrogenase component 2
MRRNNKNNMIFSDEDRIDCKCDQYDGVEFIREECVSCRECGKMCSLDIYELYPEGYNFGWEQSGVYLNQFDENEIFVSVCQQCKDEVYITTKLKS